MAKISQTVLPFKLESTDDVLTSQAGLVLFGEFCQGLGLDPLVNRYLPGPGSSVGYAPSSYVSPLVLMLNGGGRSLEDLRQLRHDTGLLSLLGIKALPSSDAVGDWLLRGGKGEGVKGLAEVNRIVLQRRLRREDRQDYTLDIDATQIVAEKRSAHYTYKGEKGYMPMVGTLAEVGMIAGIAFRDGNVAPAKGNLEFLQYCEAQMPRDRKISAVRADSAAYQAEIFNWCEDTGKIFAIGADQDSAVKALIRRIPESDWQSHGEGQIAETVHCMTKTRKAFRLIVLRRPQQQDLLDATVAPYKYHVIASNDSKSAKDTLIWYSQRGDASENRIKDIKIGFGMERMPCGTFEANAMFFAIGALAYNLYVMFRSWSLGKECRSYQVQTVRWRLFQTAGKIVRHAGQIYLKVRSDLKALFDEIRTRCYALLQEDGAVPGVT